MRGKGVDFGFQKLWIFSRNLELGKQMVVLHRGGRHRHQKCLCTQKLLLVCMRIMRIRDGILILKILRKLIKVDTWQEASGTHWSPCWQVGEGKSWSKRKFEMFADICESAVLEMVWFVLLGWVLVGSVLPTFESGCRSTGKFPTIDHIPSY